MSGAVLFEHQAEAAPAAAAAAAPGGRHDAPADGANERQVPVPYLHFISCKTGWVKSLRI